MFLLRILSALLQGSLRRLGELLGFEAGVDRHAPPEPHEEPRPARPEPDEPPAAAREPRPDPRSAADPELPPEPRPAPPAARPEPAPVAPLPPSRVKEVDEEPVLTAEFAEEGAEDGAGAEVHIEEPWEGYARMRVPEVTQRLAGKSTTELAAVQLYEMAHRNRSTVLQAVQAAMRA